MKRIYQKPELVLTVICGEDVIRTSGFEVGGDLTPTDGEE